MQFPAAPGWGLLLVLVGGPSPILAKGPAPNSPLFLAGVLCWWRLAVSRQSWLKALGADPCHS